MLASIALTPSALADGGAGGAEASDAPRIKQLRCGPGAGVCRRGELLSVLGSGMQGADAVVFLGGRGTRDDRRARPRQTTSEVLTVLVPNGAHSGRVKVVDTGVAAVASRRPLTVRPTTAPVPAAEATASAAPAPVGAGVFPIQGAHTYGETSSNVFTGKGRHQGNDVFAGCGTPLVAPVAGTVVRAATQDRAGNYVVLKADDGRGLAFMHMRDASLVERGERVTAGQAIGVVGETGRASGCHLHFELWTAPGWFQGGQPVDPRPLLKSWDTEPG